MIQKFIPLGSGYTDFYELLTLGQEMKNRVQHYLTLNVELEGEVKSSVGIVMNPTNVGDFQPIYICLEGITSTKEKESKRITLFKELAKANNKEVFELEVQPSSYLGDQELYFQYLTGILRANHILKPLTLRF